MRAVTPSALFEFSTTDAKARTVRAQEALIALGYEIGDIDGLVGARTRGALASFQARAGLAGTGEIDDETLDALIIAEWWYATAAAASARSEDGSVTAAPVSAPAPAPRPLRGRADEAVASPVAGASEDEDAPLTTFRDCRECPVMVALPSGTFRMGSPIEEEGRVSDEGPRRSVSVPRFAIGKFEVTVAEWGACVEAGYCRAIDAEGRLPEEPVVGASWADVTGEGVAERGFIAWLNAGADGAPYRLPSEAEWEYAARAGASTAYAFGDDPAELDRYAWFNGNAAGGAEPVGAKLPNGWGLYDMHGNVWEWVRDCWHPGYDGAPTDAGAWMSADEGQCDRAVVRGGAWNDLPWGLRAAYRGWSTRDRRRGDLGFRVARSL